MRHLICTALLCLPTSLTAAPMCDMGGADVLPVFEDPKAAFLAGDFQRFGEVTSALFTNGIAAYGDALDKMAELFPDGFDSCQTVVQRRDLGGMAQEVITFNTQAHAAPMSVYLLATPIRGEMSITYVNFNTKMIEVLDNLR
ncbi:MAG: hypothetical protein AAFP87_04205 [Pseudomonadota bacterium]